MSLTDTGYFTMFIFSRSDLHCK